MMIAAAVLKLLGVAAAPRIENQIVHDTLNSSTAMYGLHNRVLRHATIRARQISQDGSNLDEEQASMDAMLGDLTERMR